MFTNITPKVIHHIVYTYAQCTMNGFQFIILLLLLFTSVGVEYCTIHTDKIDRHGNVEV